MHAHRLLEVALLAGTVTLTTLACSHRGGREAQQAQTTITAGAVQPELSRGTRTLSEKVAAAVCNHEIKCGRRSDAFATSCVADEIDKSYIELTSWKCSPAAIRARVEECLSTIPEESCELDLTTVKERHLCRGNDACNVSERPLIEPGSSLAAMMRSRELESMPPPPPPPPPLPSPLSPLAPLAPATELP